MLWRSLLVLGLGLQVYVQAFVPRSKASFALDGAHGIRPKRATSALAMMAQPLRRMVVENISVVLLAGGVGKRMKADRPKQFLELLGKPVLLHTFELFATLPGVSRIVIVLDQAYRDEYSFLLDDPRVVFADPGKERQDSVYNGFQQTLPDASVVCIHDSARPLVSKESVLKVVADATNHGAAVLGVPMKATVKESEDGQFVLRTIARSRLWEVQTPQVIRRDILSDAFDNVNRNSLEVTDDVSMVEMIGLPVKLTEGEYTNIKLTTPEDLDVAAQLLRRRAQEA